MDPHRQLKYKKVLHAVLRGGKQAPPEVQAEIDREQALTQYVERLLAYSIPTLRTGNDAWDVVGALQLPADVDEEASEVSDLYAEFDRQTEDYLTEQTIPTARRAGLQKLAKRAKQELVIWALSQL